MVISMKATVFIRQSSLTNSVHIFKDVHTPVTDTEGPKCPITLELKEKEGTMITLITGLVGTGLGVRST